MGVKGGCLALAGTLLAFFTGVTGTLNSGADCTDSPLTAGTSCDDLVFLFVFVCVWGDPVLNDRFLDVVTTLVGFSDAAAASAAAAVVEEPEAILVDLRTVILNRPRLSIQVCERR